MLDAWPSLPIVIWDHGHKLWGMDSFIAALEHTATSTHPDCSIQFPPKLLSSATQLLVVRVDAPQLDNMLTTFFHQLIFDTLHQSGMFVSHFHRHID
jgi:hypothetical protein